MVYNDGDWGNPKRTGDLGIYGWRGRIGVIKPSIYRADIIQVEFNQLKPIGTDMIIECVYLGEELTEEALMAMGNDMIRAAKEIKNRGADIVVYGCTSGSFVKGMEYDRKNIKQMVKTTGLPSITMASAVVDALQTLKAKKVILITPYPDEINKLEMKFFAANGIKVLSHLSEVYWKTVSEMSDASPGFFYRLAKKAFVKDADAIFLSCGNIRTIEVIDIMEKDFGVPVVSSNLATIWKCLRMIGINEKINGYGKLLAEY
jgi:maleate isomerase